MTHVTAPTARRHRPPIRVPRLASFVVAATFVAACSSSDSTAPDPPADAGATAEVIVTPNTSSIAVGATLPLQAQAKNASGQIMGDVTIFWSSSDTAVATVSSAGVVTAKAPGSAQIAASAGGKSAVATLTVVPVAVASIAVLPDSGTVITGSTITLKAVTYDSDRNVLIGREITWSSSKPGVASVDDKGTVTGAAPGTAIITAASEGKTATAQVTVDAPAPPAPVATVTLEPGGTSRSNPYSLSPGDTLTVTAHTFDSAGSELVGRTITWSTNNRRAVSWNVTGAATILVKADDGLLTVTTRPTLSITAKSEGKQVDVWIRITN